jgi:putative aminopeptidase FrvX
MELLERLTQTPAIAGREDRLRELITEETQGLFDQTSIDPLGSLIGVRKPQPRKGKKSPRTRGSSQPPLKVMLAAHMDQIGFAVRHIDANGFLRVQSVGGFDTRNLFARLVTVCTASGELPGVLNPAGRPLHIATDEDKRKIPDVNDMTIDLGLPVKQVQKQVGIGDMVVIRAPFTRVGKTVVAQAMDNRVACWVAIRALQKIAKTGHACEIHCAFTVQEEVGCRGAGPASFGIEPDVVISLDTTLCVDTPGVPEDQRVTRQGDGVGLLVMDSSMISDVALFDDLERVAKKNKIKHQRTILPRGGNDGATAQRSATGRRTTALVCPTRYIHTVTEMVHTDDLYACRDLLAAYLAQAGG